MATNTSETSSPFSSKWRTSTQPYKSGTNTSSSVKNDDSDVDVVDFNLTTSFAMAPLPPPLSLLSCTSEKMEVQSASPSTQASDVASLRIGEINNSSIDSKDSVHLPASRVELRSDTNESSPTDCMTPMAPENVCNEPQKNDANDVPCATYSYTHTSVRRNSKHVDKNIFTCAYCGRVKVTSEKETNANKHYSSTEFSDSEQKDKECKNIYNSSSNTISTYENVGKCNNTHTEENLHHTVCEQIKSNIASDSSSPSSQSHHNPISPSPSSSPLLIHEEHKDETQPTEPHCTHCHREGSLQRARASYQQRRRERFLQRYGVAALSSSSHDNENRTNHCAGSTALLISVEPEYITVANLGDCQAFLLEHRTQTMPRAECNSGGTINHEIKDAQCIKNQTKQAEHESIVRESTQEWCELEHNTTNVTTICAESLTNTMKETTNYTKLSNEPVVMSIHKEHHADPMASVNSEPLQFQETQVPHEEQEEEEQKEQQEQQQQQQQQQQQEPLECTSKVSAKLTNTNSPLTKIIPSTPTTFELSSSSSSSSPPFVAASVQLARQATKSSTESEAVKDTEDVVKSGKATKNVDEEQQELELEKEKMQSQHHKDYHHQEDHITKLTSEHRLQNNANEVRRLLTFFGQAAFLPIPLPSSAWLSPPIKPHTHPINTQRASITTAAEATPNTNTSTTTNNNNNNNNKDDPINTTRAELAEKEAAIVATTSWIEPLLNTLSPPEPVELPSSMAKTVQEENLTCTSVAAAVLSELEQLCLPSSTNATPRHEVHLTQNAPQPRVESKQSCSPLHIHIASPQWPLSHDAPDKEIESITLSPSCQYKAQDHFSSSKSEYMCTSGYNSRNSSIPSSPTTSPSQKSISNFAQGRRANRHASAEIHPSSALRTSPMNCAQLPGSPPWNHSSSSYSSFHYYHQHQHNQQQQQQQYNDEELVEAQRQYASPPLWSTQQEVTLHSNHTSPSFQKEQRYLNSHVEERRIRQTTPQSTKYDMNSTSSPSSQAFYNKSKSAIGGACPVSQVVIPESFKPQRVRGKLGVTRALGDFDIKFELKLPLNEEIVYEDRSSTSCSPSPSPSPHRRSRVKIEKEGEEERRAPPIHTNTIIMTDKSVNGQSDTSETSSSTASPKLACNLEKEEQEQNQKQEQEEEMSNVPLHSNPLICPHNNLEYHYHPPRPPPPPPCHHYQSHHQRSEHTKEYQEMCSYAQNELNMMRHRLGVALNEDQLINMKLDKCIRDVSLCQSQTDGSA